MTVWGALSPISPSRTPDSLAWKQPLPAYENHACLGCCFFGILLTLPNPCVERNTKRSYQSTSVISALKQSVIPEELNTSEQFQGTIPFAAIFTEIKYIQPNMSAIRFFRARHAATTTDMNKCRCHICGGEGRSLHHDRNRIKDKRLLRKRTMTRVFC